MHYDLSYLSKKEQKIFNEEIKKNHFCSNSLTIEYYDNACVIPSPKIRYGDGGVYYNDVLVANSSLCNNVYTEKEIQKFTFDNTKCKIFDKREVVFLGVFVEVWGHCITDCLKHLWFYLYDDCAFLKEKLFVYIDFNYGTSKKIPDNFFALIEKLGIPRNQLVKITSPTKFAKVYVPEPCFFIDNINKKYVYTKEYEKIIDKLKEQVQSTSDAKKIYFTRTGLNVRRDVGEKNIENLFKKNGYTIVSPEKCTLDEQIAFLKNADLVVGTDGSIMHNCIFMKKNAKLIILRKASYINGYQLALNQVANADVTYIDAHKSIMVDKKFIWGGPFFLYANKSLCKFLNQKAQRFPLKSFLVYVIVSVYPKIKCELQRKIDKLENFLEPLVGDAVRAVKKFLKKYRA